MTTEQMVLACRGAADDAAKVTGFHFNVVHNTFIGVKMNFPFRVDVNGNPHSFRTAREAYEFIDGVLVGYLESKRVLKLGAGITEHACEEHLDNV